MATTIEYKNEFGNEVNQNQLPLLKDYMKIEKIDDSLKSEELYVDGIISRVDYQKSKNETISEILQNMLLKPLYILLHIMKILEYIKWGILKAI